MLQFTNENGVATAVSPTGLNVIAYAYGEQCGTSDTNPITKDDVIKIYTTIQDCNGDGVPVDSRRPASEYTVHIKVEELIGIPIYSAEGFSPEVIAIYIDKLIALTNPTEPTE